MANHGETTTKFQFTGTETKPHRAANFANLIMISTVTYLCLCMQLSSVCLLCLTFSGCLMFKAFPSSILS